MSRLSPRLPCYIAPESLQDRASLILAFIGYAAMLLVGATYVRIWPRLWNSTASEHYILVGAFKKFSKS